MDPSIVVAIIVGIVAPIVSAVITRSGKVAISKVEALNHQHSRYFKVIMESLLAVLKHERTDNATGEMAECESNLTKFILNESTTGSLDE